MKVQLAASDIAETLAAIGHRIHDQFASLETENLSLRLGDSFKVSLLNESQRFGLWARHLGLYENGHNSLDYRFRDAPSVYAYTYQLLDKLERSLLTSMFQRSPSFIYIMS